MTAEALGPVLSEHVHTWVYRGLATVIALPLFAFCLFMATNLETVAFLAAAGVIGVSWLVYVSWQARERLILHEHGLRIEGPLGARIVLWQDLRDVAVYHSFAQDPHAIYEVILEGGDGRKLKFRMNWTDRKTLLKHLLPHLQRRSLVS